MNLDELVSKISESNLGMSKKEIRAVLKECFNVISSEVVQGNDVSIGSFGVFTHTNIKERVYKSNGIVCEADTEFVVPAHKKAKFKPFKNLNNF